MHVDKIESHFSHKVNVRIDDINFGNHLCHSKFINIIHNTRALFLKQYHLSETNFFGGALVMLNLNIDYIHPCFFDDSLEIHLKIDEFNRATILLSYSIFNCTANKLAAHARTLIGFIDIEKNKLKTIPSEFKALFNS